MRVTLLGCEPNFSIFYVRDKEAYFASWNVVKVFFSKIPGERESLMEDDYSYSSSLCHPQLLV